MKRINKKSQGKELNDLKLKYENLKGHISDAVEGYSTEGQKGFIESLWHASIAHMDPSISKQVFHIFHECDPKAAVDALKWRYVLDPTLPKVG